VVLHERHDLCQGQILETLDGIRKLVLLTGVPVVVEMELESELRDEWSELGSSRRMVGARFVSSRKHGGIRPLGGLPCRPITLGFRSGLFWLWRRRGVLRYEGSHSLGVAEVPPDQLEVGHSTVSLGPNDVEFGVGDAEVFLSTFELPRKLDKLVL